MKQVWKFQVGTAVTTIDLPRGAKVLHVGIQDGAVCFWASVTPTAIKQSRQFKVIGTGQHYDREWEYCGTVQDGPYVWHVFEVL